MNILQIMYIFVAGYVFGRYRLRAKMRRQIMREGSTTFCDMVLIEQPGSTRQALNNIIHGGKYEDCRTIR